MAEESATRALLERRSGAWMLMPAFAYAWNLFFWKKTWWLAERQLWYIKKFALIQIDLLHNAQMFQPRVGKESVQNFQRGSPRLVEAQHSPPSSLLVHYGWKSLMEVGQIAQKIIEVFFSVSCCEATGVIQRATAFGDTTSNSVRWYNEPRRSVIQRATAFGDTTSHSVWRNGLSARPEGVSWGISMPFQSKNVTKDYEVCRYG
jgi:hypothetical protein